MYRQLNESSVAKLRKGVALLALLSASMLMTACLPSGGDDEEDEDETGGETANFAGTWSVTETFDETNCGGSTYTETYGVVLTQSGSDVTISDGTDTIGATADGNTLTWSDESEEGSVSYEATISGDTMGGGSEWTWTDGSTSCSGTSEFEAVRISGGDGDGDGDGSGDGSGDGTTDHEEVEPNDTPENATVVTMSGSSVSYSGSVETDTDDYDAYAFTTGSQDQFTITLNGADSTDDIDLLVLDSDENWVTGSESEGPDESVTVELSAGVLYYIVVEAWDTVGDAPYTLTITRN